MNKKTLLIVIVVVITIGASMAYVLLRRNDPPTQNHNNSPESTETPNQRADTKQEIKGSYIDYSDEGFASAKGTKLLFFHASWCPQCRMLDESIKASQLPDGVTIFKVDYDSHQSLRAKYGVTIQTTVVKVDDNGNKLSSYVAYDEPTFQSVKQALLP